MIKLSRKEIVSVRNAGDFDLINPQNGEVWETIRARELFDLIIKQAHHNGEPGVLFLDAANRQNPVPHLYELESTNPCNRGTNLVYTEDGPVAILDLVGRNFRVITPDGEIVQAIAFPTGVKPLFRVYVDNDASIDLTDNHNLIAADGSKIAVRDLKPGDKLRLAEYEYKALELETVGLIGKIATSARKWHRTNQPKIGHVVRVEDLGISETVYNITVDHPSHQYLVNGIVSANCGEQFLGPFENCCLGSINLTNLVTSDGKVDWRRLKKLTEITTRFLDDVVSANNYVPSVPQLAQAAHRVRRIGLGIMGLGDLMYKRGVRYGSEEGQEFAGQIMEFVRFHCMRTSILLARDRGAFPAIRGSIYDPDNLKWQPPTPLFPYTRDWDRPALDWSKIVAGIKKHGIRNGATMTVAPTGTIATVSGCEAYGCEPVFALAYIRHVNDKGRDLQLQYTSPLFEKALQNAGLNEAEIKAIVEEVNVKGSCQDVDGVPEQVRHTFVVSSDVSTDEHIRMQAAMQRFVDNAISKTINMPADATVKDVEDAYMLGWKLGCKGLTVYVTGSREKVVLETRATAQAKQEKQDMPDNQEKAIAHAPAAAVAMTDAREEYVTPLPLFPEFKKPRPRRLEGRTYRVGTPVGRTYVTINANGEGADQPFELFIHTSKAGSELAAISEAIGRLISLVLRVHSPITPRERLKEIVRQLEGIGGGHSTGFGAERVRSLPDGVAQALQEYLDETSELADEEPRARLTAPTGQMQLPTLKAIGDLCPECGEATLINEEGCRKCHTCGYSEC